MTDNECLFCKIASGEVKTETVFEDGEVLAFNDHAPSADTHILVIPKRHVPSFMELDENGVLDKMRLAVQQVIRDLKLEAGYRLVFNGGRYQHVPHLHWHILGGELKRSIP